MKKKFITDLKALIAKFNSDVKPEGEQKPEGAAATTGEQTPETQTPPATATPEGEQKPEGEQTPEGEQKPEGEQTPEEFAKPKEKDAVDYAKIEAELQSLRQKVGVLEEYTYLKDRQTQLEQRVNAATANFASALSLLEQFMELPQDDPAQDRKDGFGKNDKDGKRNEFIEAFHSLKKKA